MSRLDFVVRISLPSSHTAASLPRDEIFGMCTHSLLLGLPHEACYVGVAVEAGRSSHAGIFAMVSNLYLLSALGAGVVTS